MPGSMAADIGFSGSNTSYKNRHISETLARTLRTIPQFLSSFWINNPEQHKPERLFLSSYASETETLARTLRTIPQFLSSFWINNPGGTGELGQRARSLRPALKIVLLKLILKENKI